MSKLRGIVIHIHPVHAAGLRELWSRMKELKMELPAKNINEALYFELQNIGLRWGDAINAEEEEKRHGTD